MVHPRLPVLGIHTPGSCAPLSMANDINDASAFAFTTYRISNKEGSNEMELCDETSSLSALVYEKRNDASTESCVSVSTLPARPVESTSVQSCTNSEISERLSYSSKELFVTPMELDESHSSARSVGVTGTVNAIAGVSPAIDVFCDTAPPKAVQTFEQVSASHEKECNGLSNCKSDSYSDELKSESRQKKDPSKTELDENEIEVCGKTKVT